MKQARNGVSRRHIYQSIKNLNLSNSQKSFETLPKSSNDPASTGPSALKGGPSRIFQHPLLQNIKKIKGATLVFFQKSLTMSKKLKWGPFSLARYCILRGKKGKKKLFCSVR